MSDQSESIARQVALEVTIELADHKNLKLTPEKVIEATETIKKWIMKDSTDKQKLIERQSALKRAILAFRINECADGKMLLENADKYYKYISQ